MRRVQFNNEVGVQCKKTTSNLVFTFQPKKLCLTYFNKMLKATSKTSWVLPFVMFVLPTLATSSTVGNSQTSASTNFANSSSIERHQNLPNAKSSSSSSALPSSAWSLSATPTPRHHGAALPLSTALSKPLPAESAASPPSIFAWGHVTKYSRILYDESVAVKGATVLDVKYPEIDNSNAFTIIGIQAFANQDVTTTDTADLNTGHTTGNAQLQVYLVEGGIGYNSTIIRFSSNSTRELHYTLVIYGVDV